MCEQLCRSSSLIVFLLLKVLLHMQRLYEQERQANEQARTSWQKLLHECQVLQQRFEECNINLVNEKEDLIMDFPSCSDALNLLTAYDNQINLLLAEVLKLLFQFLHFKTVHHILTDKKRTVPTFN